jgi:dolichol-phosphate mannosyltransferase
VAFYRVLRRMTSTDVAQNAGDFRLIDRRALLAFKRLRENNRYLRGMFGWLGFRQVGVPYGFHERHSGVPKYTFRRMVRFGVDGVTSFSNVPLHLALHLGFAISALSFLMGTYAVLAKFVGNSTVPGWVSMIVVSTFLGGVQLLVLGVIGLYIGRMYDEVKRRPIYVVSEDERFQPTGGESRFARVADGPAEGPRARRDEAEGDDGRPAEHLAEQLGDAGELHERGEDRDRQRQA